MANLKVYDKKNPNINDIEWYENDDTIIKHNDKIVKVISGKSNSDPGPKIVRYPLKNKIYPQK